MTSNRKKLLLVNPINQHRLGFSNDPSTSYMPINLGIIAALTPEHWDVELVDESFEKCTFRKADLVGFTAFTANALRAYELAVMFRQEGIHTVMGGIHASMMTEEVVNYVDTVVTGEAEVVWPQLIADFEDGSIKPMYLGGITDVENIPHVRREIFKKYPYVYDLIQISRGCPMGCDFCSVTKLCGSKYRERDVEDVLDELEETSRPMLFIVDDHLVNTNKGAEERAIRLFKGMVDRKLNKLWFGQAAMNFADNDEVLHWATKSGCTRNRPVFPLARPKPD
ncbi:MAG: cobalamin-dependent protein [Bacteroidales bacterium]|nr:cobalamin-dependent protein [Bacteroidales bacterium]